MFFEFFSSLSTWTYLIACIVFIILALWSEDWWQTPFSILAIITGLVFAVRIIKLAWRIFCSAWMGFWAWVENNGWLVFGIASLFTILLIAQIICAAVNHDKATKLVQLKEGLQRHHDHYVRLKKSGTLKPEDEPQYLIAIQRESEGIVNPID